MTKISKILSEWTPGTIASASYLIEKGLTYDLIHRYQQSGWIENIGYGAYKRKGDQIEWPGAVFCLQKQLNLSVHPGGKTALELLGRAHYIPFNPTIRLFNFHHENLPVWFTNFSGKEISYYESRLFSIDLSPYLQEYNFKNFSILISSAELAAFELLYHVPQKQSFDEAQKLFEYMITLRSDMVQNLLLACNSIKVKRLFLYLAEQNDYDWVKNLDVFSVNLGSGKRMIVKNGELNKKYNITVPKREENDREPIF